MSNRVIELFLLDIFVAIVKIETVFRNKIIHHYFGIDAEAVWNISNHELKEFKHYIIDKIRTIEDQDLKAELILSFIEDNKRYEVIVDELKKL